MESIEKLRKYAEVHWEPWDALRERLNESLDKIEQEIAERYMELPVDADGVPIHPKDKLQHARAGWTFTADSLEIDRWGAHVRPNGQARIQCANCRHVNPRTIEDVLAEYGSQVFGITTEEHDELIAKYAEEIRGMMA